MPRRIILAAAALFLAGLAWSARIAFGASPISTSGRGLVAANLVILGVIATVAILLGRTPWTRRLALGTLALHGAACIAHAIDPLWITATVGSAAAAVALAPTPSGQWFASPPGQSVPAPATALALALVGLPLVIGITGFEAVTPVGWVAAGAGLVTAFAYSRANLAGLWFARLGMPALLAAAAVGLQVPAAAALILATALITWLAWTGDARNAASPLTRSQTTVPVLPEMVPADILDAAGFDSRGRPKDAR